MLIFVYDFVGMAASTPGDVSSPCMEEDSFVTNSSQATESPEDNGALVN